MERSARKSALNYIQQSRSEVKQANDQINTSRAPGLPASYSNQKLKNMNAGQRLLSRMSSRYEKHFHKQHEGNKPLYQQLKKAETSLSTGHKQLKGLQKQYTQLALKIPQTAEVLQQLNSDMQVQELEFEGLKQDIKQLQGKLDDAGIDFWHIAKKLRSWVKRFDQSITNYHSEIPAHRSRSFNQTIEQLKQEIIYNDDTQSLKHITQLEDSLDTPVNGLLTTPFISKLPEQYRNTSVSKGDRIAMINRDFNRVTSTMIEAIPCIDLTPAMKPHSTPLAVSHNNYGLKVKEFDLRIDNNGKGPGYTMTYQLDPDSEEKTVYFDKIHKHPPPHHESNTLFASRGSAQMADKMQADQVGGMVFWTVADGSGHNSGARNAAEAAASELNKAAKTRLQKKAPRTLRSAAACLLQSVQEAQKNMMQNQTDEKPVGQTTACQNLVLGNHLICCNVGDAKCFVLRPKEDGFTCFEPTEGSREGLNPKDSGGGLGAKTLDNQADLRTLSVSAMELDSGDIVVSCSDGLHDCLNPVNLGESPQDFGLAAAEWDETNTKHIQVIDQAMKENFAQLAKGCKTRKELGKKIVTHLESTVRDKLAKVLLNEGEGGVGKPDHAGFMIYEH